MLTSVQLLIQRLFQGALCRRAATYYTLGDPVNNHVIIIPCNVANRQRSIESRIHGSITSVMVFARGFL